jgi:hypothetical protein
MKQSKEKRIEELARDIAKRDCFLYGNCPKSPKHNCVSQDPKIMLESSHNYITIATWLVEENYCKLAESDVILTRAEIERFQNTIMTARRSGKSLLAYQTLKEAITAEVVKSFVEAVKDFYSTKKCYDRPNAHTLICKLFSVIDDIAKTQFGVELKTENKDGKRNTRTH